MQPVDAMARIGVESAFEVLVKFGASLEKQAQRHSPGDRRAGFPTPKHVVEAGKQALDQGWTK